MREMTLEQALNALQAAELRIVELEAEGQILRRACRLHVGIHPMHRHKIDQLAGHVVELETENQKLRAAGQTLAEEVPKLRAQQAAQDAKLERLSQSVAGIQERSSRAFMSNTELARKVVELEKERDSFRCDAERWRKLRSLHEDGGLLDTAVDGISFGLGSTETADEMAAKAMGMRAVNGAWEYVDENGVLRFRIGRLDDAEAKGAQQ